MVEAIMCIMLGLDFFLIGGSNEIYFLLLLIFLISFYNIFLQYFCQAETYSDRAPLCSIVFISLSVN